MAGLPEGYNTFYPSVAFIAVDPLAAFPPEHGIAKHAYPEVVGRVNALLEQESEQRAHFRLEMADKLFPASLSASMYSAINRFNRA